MERFWVTIGFCIGVAIFCGYLLGYLGIKSDCGDKCQCVGKVEEVNKCTGVNLSVNQITALTEIVQSSREKEGW